jgi:hypothetical protein
MQDEQVKKWRMNRKQRLDEKKQSEKKQERRRGIKDLKDVGYK